MRKVILSLQHAVYVAQLLHGQLSTSETCDMQAATLTRHARKHSHAHAQHVYELHYENMVHQGRWYIHSCTALTLVISV
jgi:hypothetical protein